MHWIKGLLAPILGFGGYALGVGGLFALSLTIGFLAVMVACLKVWVPYNTIFIVIGVEVAVVVIATIMYGIGVLLQLTRWV